MLKSIIRTLLQKFIDDIDSDNCNIENKALREEINSLKEMFREFIKSSLKSEQHGNNN